RIFPINEKKNINIYENFLQYPNYAINFHSEFSNHTYNMIYSNITIFFMNVTEVYQPGYVPPIIVPNVSFARIEKTYYPLNYTTVEYYPLISSFKPITFCETEKDLKF